MWKGFDGCIIQLSKPFINVTLKHAFTATVLGILYYGALASTMATATKTSLEN